VFINLVMLFVAGRSLSEEQKEDLSKFLSKYKQSGSFEGNCYSNTLLVLGVF